MTALSAVASPARATGAGRALLARYAEPHRRYHDQRHLAEVLAALGELAGRAGKAATVPLPVVCAAWLHDAVYDPRAHDNERRSAEVAVAVLTALGVGGDVVAETARLVLLTATHRPGPGDDNAALLCDADLAILAADPARYREYVTDVRQEYAHLADDVFRAGRAAVLRALLEPSRLYATPAGRQRWEARARRNVTAELAGLSTHA